jgi:hypothetical protein
VAERGSYGRLLTYRYVDVVNLNVELVRQGWSGFWTKYGTGRSAEEFMAAEAESGRGAGRYSSAAPVPAHDCIPRDQCCRVCSSGQTCGSGCISGSYACRKGRGCACDAGEVCRK